MAFIKMRCGLKVASGVASFNLIPIANLEIKSSGETDQGLRLPIPPNLPIKVPLSRKFPGGYLRSLQDRVSYAVQVMTTPNGAVLNGFPTMDVRVETSHPASRLPLSVSEVLAGDIVMIEILTPLDKMGFYHMREQQVRLVEGFITTLR